MKQKIYTVSALTAHIKILLEDKFSIIWITGEISNFSMPASGHYYFSIKDQNAQMSAVMFKGQNRRLKFRLRDGMKITGLGRISVYEPRGTYQIIFEHLEPKGVGELQVAFEQLKNKLIDEGLFDIEYKKELPFLPAKIHFITSPTGSVVHDMINIISRRFPNMPMAILPVKVQGGEAAAEIVAALKLVNTLPDAEIVILARGGGSLEDLQPFNSEAVAREIFSSRIPVVSAIGHETDYTISDFVADLRAPTPSAAAELTIPVKNELQALINTVKNKIHQVALRDVSEKRAWLTQLGNRLVHPRRKIEENRLKLDDLTLRMNRLLVRKLSQSRERHQWLKLRLQSATPLRQLEKVHDKLALISANLLDNITKITSQQRLRFQNSATKLEALNPRSILERGYSITRIVDAASNKKTVVIDPENVSIKQDLEIIVARGRIDCTVKGKHRNGEENI